MRKAFCVAVTILCLTLIGIGQQRGDSAAANDFTGTWSGTWDGAGSGGFELTIEKANDGKLTGAVSVTGEPTYKAAIRTLSFEGNKMTAAYDFTPDPQLEVILALTFDGKKASGTWTARQKGGGTDIGSGGLNVEKK